MTTFMPTTVMAMIGTWGLSVAYMAGLTTGQPAFARARRITIVLALQCSATVLALLVLAPLYLPVVEALTTIGAVESYTLRVFYPVTINNLIGAFTPKHVFESYNAIDPSLWQPNAGAYIGNVAFHFGIVGMALLATGVAARQTHPATRAIAIAAAALLILAFGRLYAVPEFAAVVELFPFCATSAPNTGGC